MNTEEKDEIIIKKKNIDNSSYRFREEIYCPKCHWMLMSRRIYIDLATVVVDEKWDCKHYEWISVWCNPEISDKDSWKCKMVKPLFDELKDRIVRIVSDTSDYYLLVKKKAKRKLHMYRK